MADLSLRVTVTVPESDPTTLRTPGPHEVYHTNRWRDSMGARCQRCGCLKSGDPEVPNVWQECCEDIDCPCHKEARDG
jgi:hypothetical protein